MRSLYLTLALIFIVGCSAVPQRLDPEVYYRHDICFKYETDKEIRSKIKNFFKRFKGWKYRKTELKNEEIEFCGVGVLPYLEKYDIEVKSFGKLNYFSLTTCHEESTTENPDDGIFKKNGLVKIRYTPTIERGKACPMYVAAYNRAQKHAWGILLLEDPRYQLEATVHCNGYVLDYNGVSICQSRKELVQKISFNEPVKLIDPVQGAAGKHEPCPPIGVDGQKEYEFLIPGRECYYGFIGMESKKIHKLLTIGYEDVIIRE